MFKHHQIKTRVADVLFHYGLINAWIVAGLFIQGHSFPRPNGFSVKANTSCCHTKWTFNYKRPLNTSAKSFTTRGKWGPISQMRLYKNSPWQKQLYHFCGHCLAPRWLYVFLLKWVLIALQVKRSLPKAVLLQLNRSHFRNREHMKKFYKRKTDTNWVVKRYELPISLSMEEKPSKSSRTTSFFFLLSSKPNTS